MCPSKGCKPLLGFSERSQKISVVVRRDLQLPGPMCSKTTSNLRNLSLGGRAVASPFRLDQACGLLVTQAADTSGSSCVCNCVAQALLHKVRPSGN